MVNVRHNSIFRPPLWVSGRRARRSSHNYKPQISRNVFILGLILEVRSIADGERNPSLGRYSALKEASEGNGVLRIFVLDKVLSEPICQASCHWVIDALGGEITALY